MKKLAILGLVMPWAIAASVLADNGGGGELARQDFPTFGVSCVQPAGATSKLPGQPGDVAMYQSNTAVLLLEVEPVTQGLDDYSAAVAARTATSVVPGNYSVGGENAVKLAGTAANGVHVDYVVLHDGRGYLFNALGRDQASANAIAASIASSAQFASPDAPSEHITSFFRQPFNVLGLATINGPSCLRAYAHQANSLVVGVHDFNAGIDPLMVTLQHIQVPGTKSFSAIQASVGPALKEKLHLDDTPVWRPHPSVSDAYVSQWVGYANPAAPARHMLARYAALDLSAGDYLQLVFTIEDRKDLDIDAYKQACDQMLETLQPIAPPSAAAAP